MRPDALRFAEVAARLGCSERTVKRLVRVGRLESVVIGTGEKRKFRRVTEAALNRFLENDRTEVRAVRRVGKLPPVPEWVA